MRITTVTGLALAGAAVAAAVGLGTAAYADEPGRSLVITTEDSNRSVTTDPAVNGAATQGDCPENGGGSAPPAGPSQTAADSL
jgi:hypothetical protein